MNYWQEVRDIAVESLRLTETIRIERQGVDVTDSERERLRGVIKSAQDEIDFLQHQEQVVVV